VILLSFTAEVFIMAEAFTKEERKFDSGLLSELNYIVIEIV